MNAKVNHVVSLIAFVGVLLLSGCQAVSLHSVITVPDGNVYRIDSIVQSNAPPVAKAASLAPHPVSAMHGAWQDVPVPKMEYMWDYATEHADPIVEVNASYPADRYFDKDSRPADLPGGR